MPNFTAGTTFGANDTVTNTKLNNLIADATINPECSFGINSGTIGTLGCTRGTVATLNSTTGTIATLNSTTGTIPTLVATTLVTIGTGTAAAPAIVPTGDSNTGIFFPAADTIAFSEGGAEAMRIDSSGRVGINVTSPLYKLQVDGDAALTDTSSLYWSTVGGTTRTSITGDSSGNLKLQTGASNTERMRITSGGYLKASNTGTYVNSAAAFHEIRSDSSGNEALVLSNSATTAPYGMQIRFTETPNDAASTFLSCNDGNGTTIRADLRSNGGFRNYQANDANLSDERLKKDIIASPNYLEKICSIPVVNFKYKDQTHDDYNLGVIAQQLEAVCPEFVDADGFGETPADGIPIKTIYQTDLQYALMKCIQELKSENNSLKSRIEALEAA